MSKTKKNILNASRLLFNEQGYSQVTIRMIALKLSMSSGNLNYHFRKRDDILEALYFEMVAEFDARIMRLGMESISFKIVKEEILSSMSRMVAYQFFWTDLFNLLNQNDKIRIHFDNAYKERIKGSHLLFSLLKADGLLAEPLFKNEYQLLIERMVNHNNTWLYASFLYEKEGINQEYIDNQANSILLMLYPYLTKSGKKEVELLIPEYFDKGTQGK